MMGRWFVLISFIALLHAQIRAPKYSNEFLRIGVGAAAAGMGNAQTGFVYDVTAGYWNPAALVSAPHHLQAALMHAEYFAGIAKYDYGSFVAPLPHGRRLGASFIRLGIDDIPNTLQFMDGGVFNYDKITSFSVADMALLISYATPTTWLKDLSIGTNVKVIHRRVGDFALAWGFGIDIAASYVKKRWRMGAILRDVTSTFNAWSFNTSLFEEVFRQTGNEIPQNSIELTLPSLSVGGSYRLFPKGKKFQVTFAMDWDAYFDGKRNTLVPLGQVSLDPRIGVETNYKETIFLRLGAYNFQKGVNRKNQRALTAFPTAGVGIRLKAVQIDYALSNFSALGFSTNQYSHLISLTFTWER